MDREADRQREDGGSERQRDARNPLRVRSAWDAGGRAQAAAQPGEGALSLSVSLSSSFSWAFLKAARLSLFDLSSLSVISLSLSPSSSSEGCGSPDNELLRLLPLLLSQPQHRNTSASGVSSCLHLTFFLFLFFFSALALSLSLFLYFFSLSFLFFFFFFSSAFEGSSVFSRSLPSTVRCARALALSEVCESPHTAPSCSARLPRALLSSFSFLPSARRFRALFCLSVMSVRFLSSWQCTWCTFPLSAR